SCLRPGRAVTGAQAGSLRYTGVTSWRNRASPHEGAAAALAVSFRPQREEGRHSEGEKRDEGTPEERAADAGGRRRAAELVHLGAEVRRELFEDAGAVEQGD